MAKHYEEELNEMEIIDDVTENVECEDDFSDYTRKEYKETDAPDIPSAISWLDKAAAAYKKHGFWGVLKGIFFMLVACLCAIILYLGISFMVNPGKYFDYYNEWNKTKTEIERIEHEKLIAKRMENTPKIQAECDKLLWKTGGQRVLFLEMHNNTGNISGLPFYYADASCESMDDGIHPVSDYCKQVKLSLMPFATELFENGAWHGTMDELYLIDKAFYYKMMASGADHLAAVVVEGTDQAVGMLFVMYGPDDDHTCSEALAAVRQTAMKIAILVEIGKTTEK